MVTVFTSYPTSVSGTEFVLLNSLFGNLNFFVSVLYSGEEFVISEWGLIPFKFENY